MALLLAFSMLSDHCLLLMAESEIKSRLTTRLERAAEYPAGPLFLFDINHGDLRQSPQICQQFVA